jgi:PAS domain S-box-containing protein
VTDFVSVVFLGSEGGSSRTAAPDAREVEAVSEASGDDVDVLRQAVEALPDPVVAIDLSTNITVWNAAATRVYGWTAEEVLGRSAIEIGVGPQDAALAAELAETVFSGQPWEGLFPIRARDGRPMLVRHYAAPLRAPDGSVSGLVVVHRPALGPEAESERAEQRLALMWRASSLLGSSLDVDRTLASLADLLVPAFADHCVVDLYDASGQLVRIAVAHSDAVTPPERGVTPLGEVVPYPPSHPVSRALALGRPIVIQSFSREDVEGWAPSRTSAKFAQSVGAHAVIAVPLRGPRSVRGALTTVTSVSGRDYDVDDVTLIEEIATRAGLALDNAALFTEQRAIAVSLQESLLPRALPDVDGASLAFRYRPTSDAEVGGDFYDVVPLSAGRVGLVIGDVQGRGPNAAAVMGQIRSAFRAYALLDLEPGRVLEHLDAMVREFGEGFLVTGAYGIYDPFTRELSIANAGHPAPLRISGSGVSTLAVDEHVPLGVGGVPFGQQSFTVAPGAGLLLYTDGVVEHRQLPYDQGVAELSRALESAGDDPTAMCDAAMTFSAGPLDDDRAVLALRATTADLPYSSLTFSATPEAVAPVRRHIGGVLSRWGLPDHVELAELLVSELVTNAVRHAVRHRNSFAVAGVLNGALGGPEPMEGVAPHIELAMRAGSTALWVEVRDPDVRLPRLRIADVDDEGGRGLYLVDALADRWGARPTGDGKIVWFELAR